MNEKIEIKPMIYSTNRGREVLFADKFRDVPFYIISLGSHPVAYVDLKDFENVDLDMLERTIRTHCGITYNENYLYTKENERITGKFLGWDYGHFGDYMGYEELYPEEYRIEGKKWTTEEIFGDVIDVINQVYELWEMREMLDFH